jgi:exopolysaccharide production protein ExoQ
MSGIRKFLVLFVLGGCAFLLSKAMIDMFLVPEPPPYGGNATARLILTVSYLSVAITLVSHFRQALFVVRRNWFLLVLVFLAFVSCLWAESPGQVLQRSVAVLGTTLLGIALAVRLSLEEQLHLLRWIFRAMGILSLVCVLFFPNYGISHSLESLGDWQGIFGYKNMLGAMMALSILTEWHLPAVSLYARFTKWLAMLLSAVLLIFSNSITPLVAIIVALFLIEIYKFAHQRVRMPLYAIFLAGLLVMGCSSALLTSYTSAVGRSSNLSGRTEIWQIVLSRISERPVVGWGYSGFWYGSSQESFAAEQAIGTIIMYSHNGYLEILLSLGALGFLLALAFLGAGMKRAYYWSEIDRSSVNHWPLAFLLFFMIYNLGECTILLQDLQWALCVSVVASTDTALFVSGTEHEEESIYLPAHETA